MSDENYGGSTPESDEKDLADKLTASEENNPSNSESRRASLTNSRRSQSLSLGNGSEEFSSVVASTGEEGDFGEKPVRRPRLGRSNTYANGNADSSVRDSLDVTRRLSSWISSFWIPSHVQDGSINENGDDADFVRFQKGLLESFDNERAAESSSRPAIDPTVWLMGVRYEVSERASSESSRSFYDPTTFFSTPGTFPQQQLSFASYPPEFYDDFTSRIWCTYRHNYPPIRPTNFTSDAGWGCMLRTGQSLLANALLIQFLGREWRRVRKGEDTWGTYVQILTWFIDNMSSHCPFSVHRIALLGKQLDKNIGEWFGPSTASQAIKALVEDFPMVQLSVVVATDVVYKNEVYKAAKNNQNNQEFQSVLILVATRLGINNLNPRYYDALKALFKFPESVGIAGGKPSSSYYFIGTQGDDLLYLDPHSSRAALELKAIDEYTDEELATYHCETLRKINISYLDPSMLFGFYCRTADEFEAFCGRVEEIANEYKPIFTIAQEEPVYDDNIDMFDEEETDEVDDTNIKTGDDAESDDDL